MKPRIYVDFDDVLCETAQEFLRVLDREFGRKVAFDEIYSFDLAKSFGLDSASVARLMQRVHQPDVLAAMQPAPGAVEALRHWADAGCEIWVVTGRPAYTRSSSEAWLHRHRVPYDVLDFVDKYGRVDPREDRTDLLNLSELTKIDFCIAVEDSPDMVKFLTAHTRALVVMLARPWNEKMDLGSSARFTRCKNWQEILRKFPSPNLMDRPSET